MTGDQLIAQALLLAAGFSWAGSIAVSTCETPTGTAALLIGEFERLGQRSTHIVVDARTSTVGGVEVSHG